MKRAFQLCGLLFTFLFLFSSCDATDPNLDDEMTPSKKWDGTANVWIEENSAETALAK